MTKLQEEKRSEWIHNIWGDISCNPKTQGWLCGCSITNNIDDCADWAIIEQSWAMWKGLA